MLPLDYYSLGYCISHSQCQWVLELKKEGIDETGAKMLAAGAATRNQTGGSVVGLKEGTSSFLAKCLSILLAESKSIVCQQKMSLKLSGQCESHLIAWPDLSALRVLELVISGESDLKLNTLLHHLSLESLTLAPVSDDSGLVYEDCMAIGDHITSTTSLKELCILSGTDDGKGVDAITAALASNQSLPLERLEFECTCNKWTFTATAGDSLAQFITNTTTLKYLSIKGCTFSAHELLVLTRAIHHNSILQTKIVEGYILTVNGDNEAKTLAQLLVECQDLVDGMYSPMNGKYYIRCNGVSDAGAVAVAQALHHNSTLTQLYFSNSSISDAGAVALADALHHNSTLTELNLSNSSISDAGTVALAQTLHHNSTLTRLDLYGNDGIGEEGTHQLLQALTVNTSISWNGLCLPIRCNKLATKFRLYFTVKSRMGFR